MTTEEKLKMYREKRQFIHGVSMAFIKVPRGHSVDGVVYEVFFREDECCTDVTEWITVQYDGGAEAHRVVTGNSNAANFEVVASMVHGGCYEQNFGYKQLATRGYKKMDLNKMFNFEAVE